MEVVGDYIVLGSKDIRLGRPFKAKRKIWAKEVTRVDTSKKDGFAFEGRFLRVRGDPAWIDDQVRDGAYVVATEAVGSTNHPRTGIALYRVSKEGVKKIYDDYFDSLEERVRAIRKIAEIVNSEEENKLLRAKTLIRQAIELVGKKKVLEIVESCNDPNDDR